jgi:hypothetical protein
MALTESKIKDLEDKNFDQLYVNHKAVWDTMAKTARDYARVNITGGRAPRPDDVAKVLFPMLQVHDEVRKHQDDNKARAKRFVEWFVEYVIDKAL